MHHVGQEPKGWEGQIKNKVRDKLRALLSATATA